MQGQLCDSWRVNILQAMLSTHMIRRHKIDVLDQLPALLMDTVVFENDKRTTDAMLKVHTDYIG